MSIIEVLRDRVRDGAGEFCQSELWPMVDEFEKSNAVDFKALKSAVLQAAPPLVGGWIVLTILQTSHGSIAKFLSTAGFIAMAVGFFIVARELAKTLRQAGRRHFALMEIQKEIKQKALQFLDPGFRYDPKPAFPTEVYQSSGLFPKSYDRATAEDRCTGKVGATKFELVEIATFDEKRTRDSNGKARTTMVPIFKGLLFKADFNKNFSGHTIVEVDHHEESFGRLARGAQRLFNSMSSLKLVELENAEFESVFKVRSTDPIEARYLLTPVFMEQVLTLKNRQKVEIQIAFKDSAVWVAIPHPGSFLELGYSLNNLTESVEKMLYEIVHVLSVVEDLDLNNRIWNKKSDAVGA